MKTTTSRALFLLVLGALLLGGYLHINHRPIEASTEVFMPGWVPFWPILALPYLSVMVVPWFLPLALKSRERFAACVFAFLLGFAVVIPLWIFCPTEMARPPVSMDWWNWPYRRLIEVDRPANILPCGHIVAPVVATWFVGGERRNWLKVMVPLVLLGMVTIVTTWQHRPVDVLIGCGIAIWAIGCSEWFGHRRKRKRQGCSQPTEGSIP